MLPPDLTQSHLLTFAHPCCPAPLARRQWVRGRCDLHNCRFPHPPFDLPSRPTRSPPATGYIVKSVPEGAVYRRRPAAGPPAAEQQQQELAKPAKPAGDAAKPPPSAAAAQERPGHVALAHQDLFPAPSQPPGAGRGSPQQMPGSSWLGGQEQQGPASSPGLQVPPRPGAGSPSEAAAQRAQRSAGQEAAPAPELAGAAGAEEPAWHVPGAHPAAGGTLQQHPPAAAAARQLGAEGLAAAPAAAAVTTMRITGSEGHWVCSCGAQNRILRKPCRSCGGTAPCK